MDIKVSLSNNKVNRHTGVLRYILKGDNPSLRIELTESEEIYYNWDHVMGFEVYITYEEDEE